MRPRELLRTLSTLAAAPVDDRTLSPLIPFPSQAFSYRTAPAAETQARQGRRQRSPGLFPSGGRTGTVGAVFDWYRMDTDMQGYEHPFRRKALPAVVLQRHPAYVNTPEAEAGVIVKLSVLACVTAPTKRTGRTASYSTGRERRVASSSESDILKDARNG